MRTRLTARQTAQQGGADGGASSRAARERRAACMVRVAALCKQHVRVLFMLQTGSTLVRTRVNKAG